MSRELQTLHNVAYFVGALAQGAEQNLGRGSLSICSMAGKRFGQQAVEGVRQTENPEEAVEILREALATQGIVWDFEPFRYGHEQKQSLCYMAHGVFAGAMESIMPGTKVELDIVHAGPNGCLKEMVWEVHQ